MKRLILFLLISVAGFAQYVPVPFTKVSGGGGAVQQTVAATIVSGSATPSTTIVFTTVSSSQVVVIWAYALQATALTTPTGSGAGCSGTTFSAIGTPTTGGDAQGVWAGTLSSGACTVTIAATNGSTTSLTGAGVVLSNAYTPTGALIGGYAEPGGPNYVWCSTTQSCALPTITSVPSNSVGIVFTSTYSAGSAPGYNLPSGFTFNFIDLTNLVAVGTNSSSPSTFAPVWYSTAASYSSYITGVAVTIPL